MKGGVLIAHPWRSSMLWPQFHGYGQYSTGAYLLQIAKPMSFAGLCPGHRPP